MEETIAAIATPPGKGGIAIVRISGDDALRILKEIFLPEREFEPRRMYHGRICDQGAVLDDCLAVFFSGGASYTGEPSAEIQCHGGYAAAGNILGLAFAHGARAAQRGEFTRRAFLNGRMDLSQAEAVADTIEAETVASLKAAQQLLSGALGEKIRAFQAELKDLLALIEASIDYPDEMEDNEVRIRETVSAMLPEIRRLLDSYRKGRITREGLSVCLLGLPNAGKSSVLNALCGRERAIVTAIPGTTRDTLHETLEICGVRVELFDTAGIRETGDEAEKAGVARSVTAAQEADLVLAVSDACEADDFSWLPERGCDAYLFNKSDLPEARRPEMPGKKPTFYISAKTGQGMNEVQEFLERTAAESDSSSALALTGARQFEALQRAEKALLDALSAPEEDMAAIDLTDAWSALGELTGETVSEDIVDRIFEKFCVGK